MELTTPQPPHWTLAQRQLLRFFAVYFIIYYYSKYVDELWDPIVSKAGQLLGIWKEIIDYPNGSGDTTYNYVQLLCMVVFALAGSIIWWAIDHKRRSYNALLYWLMALLRYTLAFYLIAYGSAKLYQSQFPFPFLRTLMKPYGDATPMNLAWTFIGYSYPYNVFIGMAEVIGGGLLLFRRTTMFGCLFSMTVLCNIVAMNFFYDIPVKLFSLHLLLTTVFICVPYLPRLWAFFMLHKELPALPKLGIYNTKTKRIAHIVIKLLVLGVIVWSQVSGDDIMDYNTKPPLYGIYQTDTYVHNSDTLLPLVTDSTMWRYLIIDRGERGGIIMMNGKSTGYQCEIDTIKKTIHYSTDEDSIGMLLNYRKDTQHLYITYIKPKDTIQVQLHTKDINDFKLLKTGFHWVNEYPNNR